MSEEGEITNPGSIKISYFLYDSQKNKPKQYQVLCFPYKTKRKQGQNEENRNNMTLDFYFMYMVEESWVSEL